MNEVIVCATCRRMFSDTDGTRVCPSGHENGESDTDFLSPRKVQG